MPKDSFKWRSLEEERQKAMRKLELSEAREQSYANKFSSKRIPIHSSRKERQELRMIKKAYILLEQIKLKEKKQNV